MALGDTYTIITESDMKNFAHELGQEILNKRMHPCIIGLSGDLGVGKTTLVQFLGDFFGVTEHMTSPTYVIMKKYTIEKENFTTFVHMDTYRVLASDEDNFGFHDLLQNKDIIVCIEWPEKISQFLVDIPVISIHIDLIYNNNNPVRSITIK